jgi:hypothetical protein
MWPRERRFADLLDEQKREWVYPSPRFRLGNTTYRPDFYLPKEDLYIEVVGTRQAYHNNRNKIAKFMEIYPKIKFKVISLETNVKTYFGIIIPRDKRHISLSSCVKGCETCRAMRRFWAEKGLKRNKEIFKWIHDYNQKLEKR